MYSVPCLSARSASGMFHAVTSTTKRKMSSSKKRSLRSKQSLTSLGPLYDLYDLYDHQPTLKPIAFQASSTFPFRIQMQLGTWLRTVHGPPLHPIFFHFHFDFRLRSLIRTYLGTRKVSFGLSSYRYLTSVLVVHRQARYLQEAGGSSAPARW